MALSRLRYLTARGMEVPVVTAFGMREIDRIAVEETGPNLFQMMENAGRNLALQAIEALGPDWRERHVLVLAGGGGNGGGICAARQLANRGAAGTKYLKADTLRPNIIPCPPGTAYRRVPRVTSRSPRGELIERTQDGAVDEM